VLQAERVSKYFGDLVAVRSVTLAVHSGEVVGLVGASGSGKSTLLNLMAGLLDSDDGNILFNEERVQGPSERLVAGHPQIKLVHQEYQLMPNITIRDNIAYSIRFYEKQYQEYRVKQLLALCRLDHVANRLPKQVSGGEKQRTAIARAIAEKPADGVPTALLLDEPFSHLDSANRDLIRELILDLVRNEKTACLFVTHDAADALSISDRIGILQNGRLIQLDTPQQVYRFPHNAYVAHLTGLANIIRAKHLPAMGIQHSFHPNATVCVRPEQFEIHDRGLFGGIIRRIFFKGHYSEVQIELSRYAKVTLVTDKPEGLAVGQLVGLNLLGNVHWLRDG
jgi:ABC-type sulfate/molybdate transport systems ATPase subunit